MTISNKYGHPIFNTRFVEQAGFWIFMFLFIFDYHFEINNWRKAAWSTLTELGTYASLVYLNLFVCIPLFLKKSKGLYLISLIGLVCLYISLIKLLGLESTLYEIMGWRSILSMALNATLYLFISYLYWYFVTI